MTSRAVRTVTVAFGVAAAALVGLGVAPATAAGPTFEREDISFEFDDALLTAECGVPVTTSGEGHATNRFFDETDRTGIRYVRSVNVALTFRSGDHEVTLRDVGGDVERVTADGTRVLSIVGQLPFWFTGVIKVDLDTGEVLQQPQRYTDADRVCAALTA
jgi:hypothetical protein